MNINSSLAYHGRAPIPPPIITSPHSNTSLLHPHHHNHNPLRSTSPASLSLSVPAATLSPTASLLRPTSLPPPHAQNHLQLDRPSSEHFLSQPAHLPPFPPSAAYLSSENSEHPTENLRPHGHMLGPTPLSNDMMLELMIAQAIRDASGFEIVNAEAVEVLKKEHDDLADRASDLVPRLAREEKIREGARNMLLLYRENKTASLKAQEELASANIKVDGCATELWKITNRRMGLQRKILQHNAAVLASGIRKMEDVVRREGKTTNPNSVLSGSSGRHSVTPDEWEAREDEFQQAFKLACEERNKERKMFETALEEKDKIIIDMRDKMESLEDSLKQALENRDVGKVPVQIPVTIVTAPANTNDEDVERASNDPPSMIDVSKEDWEERDVRELEISGKPNEMLKESDIPKKPNLILESSVPSTSTLDIRTVIQDSMREIMMEQNRSAIVIETERALRTELEGKIRGLEFEIRQRSESFSNSESSRREEAEQKYATLQSELSLVSERAERDLVLLEEARAKILWFETELEIRESQSVRLEELEQRAKDSEEELERVRAELENISVTRISETHSSTAETRVRDNDTGDNGDSKLQKTGGSADIDRINSGAVDGMNFMLGQLGRAQAELAALQDYNKRLLNLLKRLDRELPTLSTPALGTDTPTSAAPYKENSGSSPAPSSEHTAREFTLDAFFQRVQSLAHENRVLLKQVHDLQKRNEILVIQTDEFTDRNSTTGICNDESATALEMRRAGFEEERAELLERVRELEKELARASETHFEEVRKILEDTSRAEWDLREDVSLLKTQNEELETELCYRRKIANAFESDRRVLEARAESASVKAGRYRNELSEAQLKAFTDATAGLAIDGAEALKREFRRLMNDLRSEHAEEVRVEIEERKRLERFVTELRGENEEVVTALANATKTAKRHDVSEPLTNSDEESSQHGIASSHPPVVPPRPPLQPGLSSDPHPAEKFGIHHPNDSFLSTLSTSTSPSFHSVRSTSPERRDLDVGAEQIETNDDESRHHHNHPVSYTLRDNPYPFDDPGYPMHRSEGPPIPTPRTNLPSSPTSSVRPGSTRNPPLTGSSVAPDVTSRHRYLGTPAAEREDDEFGPTPGFPNRISPALRPEPTQDQYRQEAFPIPPSHGFHPAVATSAISSSSSQSPPYPYTDFQQQQQQQQQQQKEQQHQQYFGKDPYTYRPERNLPPIPHFDGGSSTTERGGKGGKKSSRFTFSLGGR